MKEAKIFSLVMLPMMGQFLITLEEVGGTRLVPIWIGAAEANAIAAHIGGHKFPRPMTHDLLVNTASELGATVNRIVVTDIKNDTYYAQIEMMHNGKPVKIDSRPSDAIAVAVRAKVPIFIDSPVFEKCPVIQKPISKEEVEGFKEKLKALKPEDFFKKKGPS